MKTIIARLAVPARVVADAIERENKTFEKPYACTIAGDDKVTVIKGPAQFVMFVIGALAAVGEDGLLNAEAVEA